MDWPDPTCRLAAALASSLLVAAVAVGCGEATTGALSPTQRAVPIETEGCGLASGTSGAGIVVGDGRILTVAHVVAGSSTIQTLVRGESVPLEIIAYDPERDLVLLSGLVSAATAPDFVELAVGDEGRIVGAGPTAEVDYVVAREALVEIDVVRQSGTATRHAYEVLATTEVGDSGSGAYDGEDRLGGIVFAIGDEGGRTWVTAADEIESFLADEAVVGSFVCDDEESSRVRQP